MRRLRVTHVQRTAAGQVTALYGPTLGFVLSKDAIDQLRGRTAAYYVREASFDSDVRIRDAPDGPRLYTTTNPICRNNLGNLPLL